MIFTRDSRVYSQSFLLWDVKGGCHVDEGGKAVQVVTVGMRKDGVCLNKRGVGVEKKKKMQLVLESQIVPIYD